MKRHIIFTNGRSGSNYLANTLNLHPQITNYGEVLGDWTVPYQLHLKCRLGGASITEYLDYIYASPVFFYLAQTYSAWAKLKKNKKPNIKFWPQIHSLGIKDFSINFKKRKIQNYLQKNDDLLVINLYRENSLRRLISCMHLQTSGIVANTGNRRAIQKKLNLSVEQVTQDLEIYEKETAEQLSLVNNLSPDRVLNIRYEDYFSSDQSQRDYNTLIFEFLGVDPFENKSAHKKILSNELSDLIENYDEIYHVIKHTKHEKYLHQ